MISLAKVAVIGSGPAGSTAAMLLAQSQISTLLIDRSDDMSWKVGEGLPPLAKPLLQKLGVWKQFIEDAHLPSYGNRSAWGSQELVDYDFIFDPNGVGWHLDRQKFDKMLTNVAVQSGAIKQSHAQVVGFERRQYDGWRLFLQSEGQQWHVDADFIIDATGRTSWFSKRQGNKRKHFDRLVGVVTLLAPTSFSTDCDSMTMVEATQDGWWYSALLPSQKLVVAYRTHLTSYQVLN
ncbi:NAD(P)/FAD-dependent oxidoreductase [Nostoc sp.]|uniref:NAD(P)/FAD-dependent oxidoreductase n=1 Tax=Nostoc sp. TaxID=1180 RepID=UPI002FFD1C96